MASKDYANNRFSGLSEINAGNVRNLQLAWTFSTGVPRGHEAAPLVVRGTMYFVTPYPNILSALDLKNNGAKKWEYKQGVACWDGVNRGAAYWEGKIIYNTLDAHMVAVDAITGKEVCKTKLGDINRGVTITMAPIVVTGKALAGNSGGEFGVRGWIIAVDAASEKIAWWASSTGLDSWISYDPELDLIYHGTGNPGPCNPEIRPGDNKWTAGIFARDADAGEAVWLYQWIPHDLYDYDGMNENVLVDLPINGQNRNVLVRPERNGYIYVMHRQTREVLSADRTYTQPSAKAST
jgi:lanthanide-dependent methanol dehydrogenase